MKNKVIDSILNAEKNAENIIIEAKEKASKMVMEAEANKEKSENELVETSKILLKSQTEEFEKSAKLDFENTLKTYSEEAERVCVLAKSNFSKAINVLLQNI